MSDAYQRVTWRGVTLNKRTVQMVEAAEERFGRQFDAIPQGSYSTSVGASAGTHSGAGAIDIYDHDLDGVQHAMRSVGFASWHRTTLPGVWSAHVHSIAIGDAGMSNAAHDQVVAYYAHETGLVGEAHDGTWRPNPIPVWHYNPRGGSNQDSPWDAGDVWVEKLVYGQKHSDSVKMLQWRLQTHKTAGTAKLGIDGEFGDQTRWAVRKWQKARTKEDPKDGRSVPNWQAHRLFSSKAYNVHETT